MQDYVKNDVLMDISDLDFSALTEDSLKLATIDGTVYSVPWLTMDTRACFYNKDLFAENGWEIPVKFKMCIRDSIWTGPGVFWNPSGKKTSTIWLPIFPPCMIRTAPAVLFRFRYRNFDLMNITIRSYVIIRNFSPGFMWITT